MQAVFYAPTSHGELAPDLKLSIIKPFVFSGNLDEWPRWYQAFFSTVDSCNDLTSEDKQCFLFTMVSSKTLQTIFNFHPFGASYATALRRRKAM